MMTGSRHDRLVEWLRNWLIDRADPVLPRVRDIAKLFPHGHADAYLICGAFERLKQRGIIYHRRGTPSKDRGHQAIQIVASGKVLKTAGCPFEPT